MKDTRFVGLDVHKESTAVAVVTASRKGVLKKATLRTRHAPVWVEVHVQQIAYEDGRCW